MVHLDEQEIKIIRELIRNPRISDNKASKRSGVPVMTVNRKRKALEESGILYYYTTINHGKQGTGDFFASQLYIIKFKLGLTNKEFLENIRKDKTLKRFNAEHIVSSKICEKDGHLALMLELNAHTEQDLNECFNGHLVPMLKRIFGDDCIKNIETIRILESIRDHHNYIYKVNTSNGIISKDWPDDYIFIDRKSFHKKNEIYTLNKHY